jgi:hypothetical protein
MTVILTLPPEVEERVQREAAKRSIPVAEYVASVVAAAVPPADEAERRARGFAALDAVAEMGSEEEQRQTFEYLAKAIDEDRLSDRKLFS